MNSEEDDFEYGSSGRPRMFSEDIHSDSIGEYKSEFIKIVFNPPEAGTEAEYFEGFKENRDIAKIDLNEVG